MTTHVTIADMKANVKSHAFSYFLRNSGDVLEQVKYSDIRLERRDGPDIFFGTERRETAVRDALDHVARALGAILRDPELGVRAAPAVAEELSWVGWLNKEDQAEFWTEFLNTIRACSDTGGYEPLVRLLHRWKVSAQIAHDPDLSALLVEDRGEDKAVPLSRPKVKV
jgi:hypothetical protein